MSRFKVGKLSFALLAAVLCLIYEPFSPAYAAKQVPTEKIVIPEQVDQQDNSELLPVEPNGATGEAEEGEDTPLVPQEKKPSEVFYTDEKLPDAVKEVREKLIAAAKTGDIEKLRPFFNADAEGEKPIISFGGHEDPIEVFKQNSGDDEGREVLAILLEVLESGWVHMEVGTENEVYAWPYFVDRRIDTLEPEQMVELFRLLTAVDYADMVSYGAYIFYRIGISPDGRIRYFVSGD